MIYIKEDVYEQLINIALETKDFKWIKELQKQKAQELVEFKESQNSKYINSGISFEDLTSSYVVIEEHGVRNIRFESEYDISYGKVGLTDGKLTYKGQNVNYRDITDEERLYVLGYLRGYYESLKVQSSYQTNQIVSPSIQNSPVPKEAKSKKWWKIWN